MSADLDKEEFILRASIAHEYKYDYSECNYNGLKNKINIICKEHGTFTHTAANHLHSQKACPKCPKRLYKNETLWLDHLNVPRGKTSRNVLVGVGYAKYLVAGYSFDEATKTKIVYDYYKDYWTGNPDGYVSTDIHPVAGLTYGEMWSLTLERKKLFEFEGYKVVSIFESEFLGSVSKLNKLIIVDNKYCQFVSQNTSAFNSVKRFLSYKTIGVEYTAAYRNGWNGITYLMDKNGYFYSGLLHKVQEHCKNSGIEITVEDRRKPVSIETPIDISARLAEMGMVPRDYQEAIVKVACENNKGIVRACTGSGKSVCTALIAAKFNTNIIIYVIGLDLLKQFHDLYSKVFDEPIGFIGNGRCDIHRINIASIWSVGAALKIDKKSMVNDDEIDGSDEELSENNHARVLAMLKNTKVHIFDESHVVATDTIKKIYNAINPEHIYGFSGTPFRDDNTDLLINGILGEKIIDVTASELIKRGILAQPIIKFETVPKMYIKEANYQSVYKEYVVENNVRNDMIVNSAKTLIEKKYVPLVLFKQIKHGKILLEKMEAAGIKCAMLYGNDSLERRAEVKEMVDSRSIEMVLASTIFDIGVDIPILSALVLAGGGRSSVKCLQRAGRILRKYPGKKYAAIIDFYDQIKFLKKHSKIRHDIYKSEEGFIVHAPVGLK